MNSRNVLFRGKDGQHPLQTTHSRCLQQKTHGVTLPTIITPAVMLPGHSTSNTHLACAHPSICSAPGSGALAVIWTTQRFWNRGVGLASPGNPFLRQSILLTGAMAAPGLNLSTKDESQGFSRIHCLSP